LETAPEKLIPSASGSDSTKKEIRTGCWLFQQLFLSLEELALKRHEERES